MAPLWSIGKFLRDELDYDFYRHTKSGGIYSVIAEGQVEADLQKVVIYKSNLDGIVWVRPASEFYDGRFVKCNVKGEPR